MHITGIKMVIFLLCAGKKSIKKFVNFSLLLISPHFCFIIDEQHAFPQQAKCTINKPIVIVFVCPINPAKCLTVIQ